MPLLLPGLTAPRSTSYMWQGPGRALAVRSVRPVEHIGGFPLLQLRGSVGNVHFSTNVDSLTPSATLALAARARRLRAEGHSIVDLSAGEPEFGTPPYAAEAGIEAIRAGHTGYPPTQGIPALRRAIASYLAETTAHAAGDESNVLVSAGVKQALWNCIFCLFGPSDEILVPAPYWPSYPTLVALAGARPVIVESHWEDGFLFDIDQLEQARGESTRGLILNYPSNPTGAVCELEWLERVLHWCGENGIWVLSDEIYRRLHHVGDGPAPSVWDVADRPPHVVVLDGVSKTFCMPGWRIGFAAGPRELIATATDFQSQSTSGAVTPAQYAAAAALGDAAAREAAVDSLLARLATTRRLGTEALSEIAALEVRPPPGAIYLYVRLQDDVSSMEVAERLLLEAGVASIPGEPFGSPGHLRFNFAVKERTLAEGMDRVRAFFQPGSRDG